MSDIERIDIHAPSIYYSKRRKKIVKTPAHYRFSLPQHVTDNEELRHEISCWEEKNSNDYENMTEGQE